MRCGADVPASRGGELLGTGSPRRAAWGLMQAVLAAGRALALGPDDGADVLWRAGGMRRTRSGRTRRGTVAAEARRMRNGVYLMVGPAHVGRRAHRLARVAFLAVAALLGAWLSFEALRR